MRQEQSQFDIDKIYRTKRVSTLFYILLGFALIYWGIPFLNEEQIPDVNISIIAIIFIIVLLSYIADLFGNLRLTSDGIVVIEYILWKHERFIPFKSITKISRQFRISRTSIGYIYYIDAKIGDKDQPIWVNQFSHWQEILLNISEKINNNLIEIDVKKKIGIG